MSPNTKQTEQYLHADQARYELAADLRDIREVGGRLVRNGEKRIKSSAIVIGAGALGGVLIGFALGRASTGRRGASIISGLMGKAITTFAATMATQLVARLAAGKTPAPSAP